MTTTTKERPILFSAPMVRAILDGRKTMTRRIISHVAGLGKVTCFEGSETEGYDFALRDRRDMWNEFREDQLLARCPYGAPGTHLWVKETWTPDHRDFYPHFPAVYKADAAHDYERNEKGEVYSPEQKSWYPYRWRSSRYMPRWASRITLRVEEVRVERLQDITDADAIAEGAQCAGVPAAITNRGAFAKLWVKINGPDSWDVNPWVWVVSFSVAGGE